MALGGDKAAKTLSKRFAQIEREGAARVAQRVTEVALAGQIDTHGHDEAADLLRSLHSVTGHAGDDSRGGAQHRPDHAAEHGLVRRFRVAA